MSYYLLPKIYNFLNVNPKDDINECEIYSSYSLYNFYDNIKKQIDINLNRKQMCFMIY